MAKITKKQLQEWEEKYPKGKLIEIPEVRNQDDEIKYPAKQFFLRKPDRATIKFAMTQTVTAMGTVDGITPGKTVLEKCWIGGDDEVKTEDEYYFRACMEANTFLNEVTGFL